MREHSGRGKSRANSNKFMKKVQIYFDRLHHYVFFSSLWTKILYRILIGISPFVSGAILICAACPFDWIPKDPLLLISNSQLIRSTDRMSADFRGALRRAPMFQNITRQPRKSVVTLDGPGKRAVIVLSTLPKVKLFVKLNHEFLMQKWHDVIFAFNTEGVNEKTVIDGIEVHNIDVKYLFDSFPPDLDPETTESTWVTKTKWGYHQMIRFFFRELFWLPEMENVSSYLRLDTDSCIWDVKTNPFGLLNGTVKYVSNVFQYDPEKVTKNLDYWVQDYINYFGVSPDPAYFRKAFTIRHKVGLYYNNMEIVDISFFKRPEVLHFTEMVESSECIYFYRWGDAPLRYLTMMLFAKPGEVILYPSEWGYKHPCKRRIGDIRLSF